MWLIKVLIVAIAVVAVAYVMKLIGLPEQAFFTGVYHGFLNLAHSASQIFDELIR